MTRLLPLLAVLLVTSACATTAANTIERSLINLGLDARTADCMADRLEDDLEADDLQDLARFTRQLDRASSPEEAFRSLRQTDNPRALLAITAAGVRCAVAR